MVSTAAAVAATIATLLEVGVMPGRCAPPIVGELVGASLLPEERPLGVIPVWRNGQSVVAGTVSVRMSKTGIWAITFTNETHWCHVLMGRPIKSGEVRE